MNENKNKAQDATLRHSEANQDGIIHFGCNKTCGNTSLSQLNSKQNPKPRRIAVVGEKRIEDTQPFCDYLVIDQHGYHCCIYNLEAPAYCLPENCPYLEGVVQ